MWVIDDAGLDLPTKAFLLGVSSEARSLAEEKLSELHRGSTEVKDVVEQAILDLFNAGQTDHSQLRNYAFYCALEYARTVDESCSLLISRCAGRAVDRL